MRFTLIRRWNKYRYDKRQDLREDVDKLADLCKGLPFDVFLAGGAGMAIYNDHVYRNHVDLNVGVFLEHYDAFKKHLSSKRYTIVTKFFRTHVFNYPRRKWVQCISQLRRLVDFIRIL